MDVILKYLLDEKLVVSLLFWQAIIFPIIAVVSGLFWGYVKGLYLPYVIRGAAVGLLGPVIGGMWLIYNQVIELYGLDTVANLFINIFIFSCSGLFLGLLFRKVKKVTETMIVNTQQQSS